MSTLNSIRGKLIVIGGPARGRTAELSDLQRLTVGRGPASELTLDDPALADPSLVLQLQGNRCLGRMIEAEPPLLQNGTLRQGAFELRHGDRLQLGASELLVTIYRPVKAAGPTDQTQHGPVGAQPLTYGLPNISALAGKQLGEYYLEKLVGEGGMGVVYRARDQSADRTVALKLLRTIDGHPEERQRFFQEAQIIGGLEHPSICGAYKLGQTDDLLYLVLEWVDGGNLEEWLLEHGIPTVRQSVEWGIQIAEALAYAHAQAVIHRDLKLSNILRCSDGRLKVIDFGLARALDRSGVRITVTGKFLGTPQFIAPEQIASAKHVDHRADLYAAGVILYRLLSDRSPFSVEGGLTELLRRKLSEGPVPLESVQPDLPRALHRLVAELLEREADDRLGDGRLLAQRLRQIHAAL